MNFKDQGIDYPLCWPVGWKRQTYPGTSKFKTSFAVARDQLMRELKLLGVRMPNSWEPPSIIISSNIPLRRDGLPLAGQSNPKDPGVAIYFRYKDKSMVFACDQYKKVEDNLYAVTKTIEAIRGIQRWGASDMMERSFTGFQALPPPRPAKRNWWEVLGVAQYANKGYIKDRYRALAQQYHPDKPGGSAAKMAEINQAYEESQR